MYRTINIVYKLIVFCLLCVVPLFYKDDVNGYNIYFHFLLGFTVSLAYNVPKFMLCRVNKR